VIKLRWGPASAKLPFEAALPRHQVRSGKKSQAFQLQYPRPAQALPSDAHGRRRTIRGAFSEARDYKKAWDDHNKRSPPVKKISSARRDLRLEPLVEVLEQALRSLALAIGKMKS